MWTLVGPRKVLERVNKIHVKRVKVSNKQPAARRFSWCGPRINSADERLRMLIMK
jgi:hypothetical protein